jgi:hypothetical protein
MPKPVNIFYKERKGIFLRVINQIPKISFYRHQVAVIIGYGPRILSPHIPEESSANNAEIVDKESWQSWDHEPAQ